MAPWGRRPGGVLVCYANMGRGRRRETFVACQLEGTRGVLWIHLWCLKGFFFRRREKSSPALDGKEKNPALDREKWRRER
ncbi:hypothetical protein TNCV_1025561 [Trichonephila clavipes]|nr:hypothetical protein TNCV_1025561 [Trichonephila clavipes]